MESGYSDSTASHISEPPDITNWFSSYVYESFPLTSLPNESEVDKENLGVAPMSKISNESFLSEPPDIRNWFLSYVYESPMIDTSDGLELSAPGGVKETDAAKIERNNVCPKLFEQELVYSSKVQDFSQSQSVFGSESLQLSALGESEYVKETEMESEMVKIKRNNVCPQLFEQELVSSAKVTDFSQSQAVLSEPPDVRNWFSSYEYQSPQLSEIQEFRVSSPENNPLIIDESDTEEETSSGIFRRAKSKEESIVPCGLKSNDYKENIAADTAKEISPVKTYREQEMEKMSSIALFDASTKEVKQQSRNKSFSLRISHCNPKPQSPSRPKHIQETISMNSSRQKSPSKAAQKACLEENMESTNQETYDKENIHGKSIDSGFVTLKKARCSEGIDRCSMTKQNRGVVVGCSSSKEFKKMARDEDQEEERKKKRKVLGEMSNHQFPGAKEIAGKWRCPQKKKGKLVPPLKQLRLDTWIHKV